MKNLLSKAFITTFTLLMSFSVSAQFPGSIAFTFSTDGDSESWRTGVHGTASVWEAKDGHLSVQMVGTDKYRADLLYNSSDGTNNKGTAPALTFDTTTDKYIAIKFIGDRPQGNIKFEMNTTGGVWLNSGGGYGNNTLSGNITTSNGNKIYYLDLSANANFTGEGVEINFIKFIIADAVQPPFEYTVDWIATFPSIESITANKDIQDDGDSDDDETKINPELLDGYIYSPFLSNTDSWGAATTESVFRNDNKLIIVKDNQEGILQTRRNAVTMNATNFPYLAVKVDMLPTGFTGQENFHIQTNCDAMSVYDSWYSVIEKKGDVYVFEMTNCVNKNTSATQDAIMTTNNADVWIDFGTVSAGAVAQIGWIKTFQNLGEIAAEDAAPIAIETDANTGRLELEFNDENASSSEWAWQTPHWRGGEWGTKISSTNGQFVLEPNDDSFQVAAKTRNALTLNASNYPYLAFKVDEMGDAGYFSLNMTSAMKGTYEKNTADNIVVTKKDNIYVFDLSAYPMISTASDLYVRIDFYTGTSGTTSPTQPVKIDWIRSYKTLDEVPAGITALSNMNEKENIKIHADKNTIYLQGLNEQATINIYSLTGHCLLSIIADAGTINIPFSHNGAFIVEILNDEKPIVKKIIK